MSIQESVNKVVQAVSSWEGVDTTSHQFGGQEFLLGKVEIGHIHRNGLVDIPFTRALRDYLINEGRVESHHVLPDSGWISFYMQPADEETAIWLFGLSYLQKGQRRKPELDWGAFAQTLNLTPTLEKLLFKTTEPDAV
jgi:hypothetical protein